MAFEFVFDSGLGESSADECRGGGVNLWIGASRAVRIANFGFALRDPARQLLGSQRFEAFAWLSF